MKNIFYFRYINKIGGIESFFFYLAKKYQDWDITIYYNTADKKQIERLKQYVRVRKYNGEKIICDKAFFNYNLDIINNVEAKEYIQIIHGCYKTLGIKPNIHDKITKYIAVSEVAKKDFEEATNQKVEVCYNPIMIEKPKRMLNLISATRLTNEKGKERIEKLANILDDTNIPYVWTIFTDDTKAINNENIIYMKPRLDITNHIKNADYLVQLSDSEAYCYSVVESLMVGTPVIVTDMPVMKEIGVNETNGFILHFDLNNVPVQEIYLKNFKFNYIPAKDSWNFILEKGKTNYKEELKMQYKVKAKSTYKEMNIKDAELGRIPEEGEVFEINNERLEILTGNNNYNAVFVEIIEDEIEINEEDIINKEKINEDEIIEVEAKKANVVKKEKKTTRKKK